MHDDSSYSPNDGQQFSGKPGSIIDFLSQQPLQQDFVGQMYKISNNSVVYSPTIFRQMNYFIQIDTIPQCTIGEKFTITAQTNLAIGDEVLVEVYSSSFKPTQKSQSGDFSGATGTVKVSLGTGSTNRISFDIDSSTFKPDEYLVRMTAILRAVSATSLFNCKEKLTIIQTYADFYASPTEGPAPLHVQFTDLSTGQPLYWNWDLNNDGTGIESTQQNPLYIYNYPGTYSVKLWVNNQFNKEDTETKLAYIHVNPPLSAPDAAFRSDFGFGQTSPVINFIDESTGSGPLSYNWDFENDGVVDSHLQNPSHTYAIPGSYSVRLTVTNSIGTDTELRNNFIVFETKTPTPYITTIETTVRTSDIPTPIPTYTAVAPPETSKIIVPNIVIPEDLAKWGIFVIVFVAGVSIAYKAKDWFNPVKRVPEKPVIPPTVEVRGGIDLNNEPLKNENIAIEIRGGIGREDEKK
jgi:PKD repeat protein